MARRSSRSRAWALAATTLLAAWTAAATAPAAAAPHSSSSTSAATPERADRATTAAQRGGAGKASRLEPGTSRGAAVVKTGWWNAAHEPPPDTGVLAAPQPPAPNVPDGGLPVAAAIGEPQKLTAIELSLDAEPGSEVTSLRMVLRESAEPGAATGAELAEVVACPVTEVFWADGRNAAWKNRPVHDCTLAEAPGRRSDDGTWRFDLTEIAVGWAAEDFSGSRSVVLVEKVEAPASFDLSFDGPDADGVGVVAKVRPGAAGTDADGEDAGADAGGDAGGGAGGGSAGSGGGSLPGGDTSGGGSGGLGGAGDAGLGPVDSGAVSVADDASGGADDAATGDEAVAAQGGLVTVAAPAWYSGLPGGAFLLVPVVLGIAYLMMLALGPDGRPAATTQRHGVSRALERLRQVRVRGTETA